MSAPQIDPVQVADALGKVAEAMHIGTRPATCPRCSGPSSELRLARRWSLLLCPECERKDREEQEAAEAELAASTRAALLLKALDVPPLYADATLESFVPHGSPEDQRLQGANLQRAHRYVAEWPHVPAIVVFSGPPGTGKGHLLWAIARAVATKGAPARVAVLSDVIRYLRAAWDRTDTGPSESARLDTFRIPTLLGIDEVSRHAFFGQPQQHLYDLVNHREMYLRPTILTTNEGGEQLSALLGEALSSRCAGWGGIWKFGGPDFRLERARRLNGVRRGD